MFKAIVNKINSAKHFHNVAFALSLESAQATTRSTREQAFVIPMAEAHEESLRDTGPTCQRVTKTFGVLILLNVRNDATGERSEEDLHNARLAVRNAIYGWQPTTEHDPILLAGGELLVMDGGLIYWLDQFKTRTYEEATQ